MITNPHGNRVKSVTALPNRAKTPLSTARKTGPWRAVSNVADGSLLHLALVGSAPTQSGRCAGASESPTHAPWLCAASRRGLFADRPTGSQLVPDYLTMRAKLDLLLCLLFVLGVGKFHHVTFSVLPRISGLPPTPLPF